MDKWAPRTWRRTWPSLSTSASCLRRTASTSTRRRSRRRAPGCAMAVRTPAPVTTDGPLPETSDLVAGWYLIEVESHARAVELAACVSSEPGPGDPCTSGSTSERSCPRRPVAGGCHRGFREDTADADVPEGVRLTKQVATHTFSPAAGAPVRSSGRTRRGPARADSWRGPRAAGGLVAALGAHGVRRTLVSERAR